MHITRASGDRLPGRWRVAVATLAAAACMTLALAAVGSSLANAAQHSTGSGQDVAAPGVAGPSLSPGTTSHSQFGSMTETSLKSLAPGISTVYIWNCHTERLPVKIWSWDYNTSLWQYHGEIAEQYTDGTYGSCGPGISTAGVTVGLQDGHKYRLYAFDQNGVHAVADPVPGGTTYVWAWTIS
jgi:hypothetical protein